jgi:hypothetical protein
MKLEKFMDINTPPLTAGSLYQNQGKKRVLACGIVHGRDLTLE